MNSLFLPEAPGAKAARHCGIWALVTAIICFPASVVLGIVAIVQNGKAKRIAASEPERYQAPSNAGIIMGILALALFPILGIVGMMSAIAIPALLGQRARARDKAAISNVMVCTSDYLVEYDKLVERQAKEQELIQGLEAEVSTINATLHNPWNPATPAISKAITVVHDFDEEGIRRVAREQATELGQVHVVIQLPEKQHPQGYLATSTQLQNPINGERNYVKVAQLD